MGFGDDGKGLSPAPRHPPTDISRAHSTFAYVRLSGCNCVSREAVSLCQITKTFSRRDFSKKKKKHIYLTSKFAIYRGNLSQRGEVQDFLKLIDVDNVSKRANTHIC